MTTHAPIPNQQIDLPGWIAAVEQLLNQIAAWSEAENWSVHRDQTSIREEGVGTYTAPTLRIRTPKGRSELFVTPVALRVIGASGRVDLEGWPSLDRLMLIRVNGNWQIVTDSNVSVAKAWGRQTFVDLANDLLTRP